MTEDEKRQARARRREAEAKTRSTPRPDLTEPAAYLEGLRISLIDQLLDTADETENEALSARIRLDLLKLSSLGRTKVDVNTDSPLVNLPNLSHLTTEQLEALARGEIPKALSEPTAA